jgi:integral membrane protein
MKIIYSMKSSSAFNWFRKIAIAEGVSFLVLLGIAMPLKYLVSFPIAVTIVGSLHGILFIAFMVLAWEVKDEPVVIQWKKKFTWLVICFIAAILPFGTFILDKNLKRQQDKR